MSSINQKGRKLKVKKSTTEEVANSIALGKCLSDVSRGSMTVGMYTFRADDGIERFKCFRRKKNGRTKSSSVICKVQEDVKLRLVKPACCPASGTQKKVFDLVVQKSLRMMMYEHVVTKLHRT